MRYLLIYITLFICILLFSGCCTFRNYATFSEPVAALDSGKTFQVSGTVSVFHLGGHIDAAPMNHLGISASGGAAQPVSVRGWANSLEIGAGYFNAHSNDGVEIFGGWGFQNFHVLNDTCSKNAGGFHSEPRVDYMISDTFFHYNYFFLRPDIWWREGTMKLIAAINLKVLGSGNYQFYLKKYNQSYPDTTQHDISVTQYEGPLRLLMVEPSIQLRLGRTRVKFLMEGKYSFPVFANINLSKYFSPSTFIFTVGLQYVFHQHDVPKTIPFTHP